MVNTVSMQKKSILLVLLAVLFIGVSIYWYKRGDALLVQPLSDTISVSTITSAVAVPEGWYSHQAGGFDGSQTILTRTKELPKADPNNYAYGEHIAIVERGIGLTPPEQYVERNVSVSGPTVQYATWGTLYGRKMLSIGFTDSNDGSRQQYIYLFGGGRFVLINLYPDKQENRAAFQQVVNYYAQSLPVISRAETLNSCKTVIFTPGEEKDIAIDSETGYVTIGYTKNGVPTHTFLNFNDDLSQCTLDVRSLLSDIKAQIEKYNIDMGNIPAL